MKVKPYFPAHALTFAPWTIFGLVFILGFGAPLFIAGNYFKIMIETMGSIFSIVMITINLLPIIVGAIIFLASITLAKTTYKQYEYEIEKDKIIAPSIATYEMGPPGNKRYITLRPEKDTIHKKDILKIEKTKTFTDKIFNTESIKIYQKSKLYGPESQLYRVTLLKNLKETDKIMKLIK